jgi:hypothetical protein
MRCIESIIPTHHRAAGDGSVGAVVRHLCGIGGI